MISTVENMGQDEGTEKPEGCFSWAIMGGSLRGGDTNSTWSDDQELPWEDLWEKHSRQRVEQVRRLRQTEAWLIEGMAGEE